MVYRLGRPGLQVRRGAEQILDRCPTIDVLINNAGLVQSEQRARRSTGSRPHSRGQPPGPVPPHPAADPTASSSSHSRPGGCNVASTAHRGAPSGRLTSMISSTSRHYRGMRAYSTLPSWPTSCSPRSWPRRLSDTGVTAQFAPSGHGGLRFRTGDDARGFLAFRGVEGDQAVHPEPRERGRPHLGVPFLVPGEWTTSAGGISSKCRPGPPRRRRKTRRPPRSYGRLARSSLRAGRRRGPLNWGPPSRAH